MAHFAEIDENNVVLRVLVVGDEQEHRGQDFLAGDLGLGGTWVQTSFNSKHGKRCDSNNTPIVGSQAFRHTYATVGGQYLPDVDAFIDCQPFPSWRLNESTLLWEAPSASPSPTHVWDEKSLAWYSPPQLNPS